MVSLADSQSPCSSTTKIQRSIGRSMRTIRSSFSQSEHSSSFDGPDSGAPPDMSEVLTDSVVDFRLHELAGDFVSSSSRPDAAKTADFLDLSQGFSDFSSFNSDISGELQRLALIPGFFSPQSREMIDRDDRRLGGVLGLRERDGVSSASSEIYEAVTLETLEPVVRSCVVVLESSLSAEAKQSAAARLRLLAKHRSDFRAVIGCSGAIPALIPLLRSADPALQENAVTALLNLSLEESNKGPITASGAIKPLVYAMKTGTATAKQNAACALLSLSMIEDNRATIGACGAIPPLVSLLLHGTSRGKKDALTTLYKLCSTTRQNMERAVSAGAVRPLVALVGEHGSGTTEKAMVVLGCLASVPEGRESIVEEGGIPVLVEAIEDGSAKGKEFAVVTLLQLCSDSTRNRGLLVREGAIPPLVALSQSGSARAKSKAETLLGYLREQRLDCAFPGV